MLSNDGDIFLVTEANVSLAELCVTSKVGAEVL